MYQPFYYSHPYDYYRSFTPHSHFPIHYYSPMSGLEQEMINLINQERQKAGIRPLTLDSRLTRVARAKATDMATIGRCPAEHYSPTFGGDEGTMLQKAGITASSFGWIIYCGQPGTASEAGNWWMNISTFGHRQNILNSNFNYIGVGSAVSRDGRRYWSVIFRS